MRRFVFIFLIAMGAINVDSWQCAFAQEEEVEVIETEINISKQGATFRPSVGGIGGELKKLYSRYLFLAAKQAPRIIASKESEKKLFSWSVCKDGKNSTLVFLTRNNTKKARKIVFKLSDKKPLPPTYRRVYSVNGGKRWKTIAFEPPHSSVTGCFQPMPFPYTIEIPPYSFQTVTVRLK